MRRLALRPPSLAGGIELGVDLIDKQHAVMRLRHGNVSASFKSRRADRALPVGHRLRAKEPDTELVFVDRAPPGLRKAAEEDGLSYLDLH